jgi:hypothetical protein
MTLFRNDEILRDLGRNFVNSRNGKRFDKYQYSRIDLNKHIPSCLLNLYLPIQEKNKKW